MALLLWGLNKTRIGCALRALAESPKAAALLGVNVEGLFMRDVDRGGRCLAAWPAY